MKKLNKIFFGVVAFLVVVAPLLFLSPSAEAATNNLAKRLSGKILLQVESKGEAWYVNPTDLNRYYMANGNAAYDVMRNLSVGITNNNLTKLQNNKNLAKKHSGKIFLQVEDKGQAYYVNSDGTLYYLKDGNAAYDIMRKLGLGITNSDLEKIVTLNSSKNVNEQVASFYNSGIEEKIQYIVQIVCPISGGTMSGTGIMIYGNSNADNKIITNKHVLNGAVGPCGIYRTLNYENQPTLYFKSSSTFIFSKNYDLAIITPDVSSLTIYPSTNIEFSQSGDLLNKNIYVLGYPVSAGNNITLTKGIISGTENINNMTMYKTDAKIDSGNSGGAVFDENGKFMGVPTLASQGDFSSYGYIIPGSVVKNFIDIVNQEGYGKQNWQYPEFSLYGVNPSNTVPEPPSGMTQNPAPQQQEDSALKVAKCQAEKDQHRLAFEAALHDATQSYYLKALYQLDMDDPCGKYFTPDAISICIDNHGKTAYNDALKRKTDALRLEDAYLQDEYIKCLSK